MARDNIRKRISPNGVTRYEVRWRTPDKKQHATSFRTREAALKFQTERRADVLRGLARDENKAKLTFGHYGDALMEQKALRVRPSTLDGYRAYLDRYVLPYFGNRPVGSITTATCIAYVQHLA